MTSPSRIGRREHLTFKGNLRHTRYGWLRLTPAYSVHQVEELLDPTDATVLDPFCGTGTTALVCAEHGVACDTTEINPFLVWLATAKTRPYGGADIDAFVAAATLVGLRRGQIFLDGTRLKDQRSGAFTAQGSIIVDGKVLLREFDSRLGNPAAWQRPHFLYFNLQSAHFPYFSPGMDQVLPGEPIARGDINAGNRDHVTQTYRNAIAYNDRLIGMLERLGVNTRDQESKLQTKNVAAVMVTANLPAFARSGSRIDIAVAPSNPNVIYAQVGSINWNAGNCGSANGCQLGTWVTTNGGTSWSFVHAG